MSSMPISSTSPPIRTGGRAVYRLLERGRHVTIEKPMAHPAQPAGMPAAQRGGAAYRKATVLFDFVEVFNPHSFQIRDMLRRLAGIHDFRITQIRCERSKDREDPLKPAEPQGHRADPVSGDGALPGDAAFRHRPPRIVRGGVSAGDDRGRVVGAL